MTRKKTLQQINEARKRIMIKFMYVLFDIKNNGMDKI